MLENIKEHEELVKRKMLQRNKENTEKIEALKTELLDKANHVANKIQFYKEYSSRAERLDYSDYNKNVSITLLNIVQAYKELEEIERKNSNES